MISIYEKNVISFYRYRGHDLLDMQDRVSYTYTHKKEILINSS